MYFHTVKRDVVLPIFLILFPDHSSVMTIFWLAFLAEYNTHTHTPRTVWCLLGKFYLVPSLACVLQGAVGPWWFILLLFSLLFQHIHGNHSRVRLDSFYGKVFGFRAICDFT